MISSRYSNMPSARPLLFVFSMCVIVGQCQSIEIDAGRYARLRLAIIKDANVDFKPIRLPEQLRGSLNIGVGLRGYELKRIVARRLASRLIDLDKGTAINSFVSDTDEQFYKQRREIGRSSPHGNCHGISNHPLPVRQGSFPLFLDTEGEVTKPLTRYVAALIASKRAGVEPGSDYVDAELQLEVQSFVKETARQVGFSDDEVRQLYVEVCGFQANAGKLNLELELQQGTIFVVKISPLFVHLALLASDEEDLLRIAKSGDEPTPMDLHSASRVIASFREALRFSVLHELAHLRIIYDRIGGDALRQQERNKAVKPRRLDKRQQEVDKSSNDSTGAGGNTATSSTLDLESQCDERAWEWQRKVFGSREVGVFREFLVLAKEGLSVHNTGGTCSDSCMDERLQKLLTGAFPASK
jgi:hypothetical protein